MNFILNKTNLQTNKTVVTICNESDILTSRSHFNFNFLWSLFRAKNETYVKCTTKSAAKQRVVNMSFYNCGTFFKMGTNRIERRTGDL